MNKTLEDLKDGSLTNEAVCKEKETRKGGKEAKPIGRLLFPSPGKV